MTKQPGLDGRHRDANGEIHHRWVIRELNHFAKPMAKTSLRVDEAI